MMEDTARLIDKDSRPGKVAFLAKKKPPPPELLSELIRLAVKDARQLNRSMYRPNAHAWLRPEVNDEDEGVMCFCDAGAVLIGTLKGDQVGRGLFYAPNWEKRGLNTKVDNGFRWVDALLALDFARQGEYSWAVEHLTWVVVDARKFGHVPVSPYGDYTTWDEFDSHLEIMEQAAGALHKMGF